MSTHTPAPSDARPTSKTSLLHNHSDSDLFSLAKSPIKLEALEQKLMGYDIYRRAMNSIGDFLQVFPYIIILGPELRPTQEFEICNY